MNAKMVATLGIASFLFAGCTTTTTALAPVGPNPAGFQMGDGAGQLEVFSALTGRVEGNNPTWRQHTSYYLYDSRGKRLQWVDNTAGYYARAPRVITLPAGKYIVMARANDFLRTKVPVVIEAGRTTRVHLDGNWQPPAGTPPQELVSTPGGEQIGWRTGFAGKKTVSAAD